MKHAPRIAALALVVPLALAGCTGATGNGTGQPAAGTSAQQQNDPFAAAPGTDVDKAAFLQGMQTAMQNKKTYTMNVGLSMQGQNMTVEGVGDVSDPDTPRMKMSMSIPDAQGQKVDMILLGDAMYMKMPGSPAGNGYLKMSLRDLAARTGQDFTTLVNPAQSLRMQQQAIEKVTYVGEEDVAGQKLRHYTAVVDMAKVPQATGGPSSQPVPTGTNGSTKVPNEMWIDGEHLLRRSDTTVQGTRVQAELRDYGKPVDIAAPPAGQVREMPSASPAPRSSR